MSNMTHLHTAAEIMIQEEYNQAARIHGAKHASPHEAYGVMLGEYKEAMEHIKDLKIYMDEFFDVCMHNGNTKIIAKDIKATAKHAIAEITQIAAMAHKAMQGYEKEDNHV